MRDSGASSLRRVGYLCRHHSRRHCRAARGSPRCVSSCAGRGHCYGWSGNGPCPRSPDDKRPVRPWRNLMLCPPERPAGVDVNRSFRIAMACVAVGAAV